jgi:UDPglucose--hexose-1-phosphate uridylyltransferase
MLCVVAGGLEFRSQKVRSRILHPARDFEPVEAEVEVRWDPLTGHAARLVKAGSALLAPAALDLEALARETKSTCPFCTDRIEQATPKLPADLCAEGRIRRGRALLFPNLLTYTQFSGVAVYSPDLHYLPLGAMTPRLVADNLGAHVEYIKAVMKSNPDALWASINANHMLPSGSSLFHPHLQSSVDPLPSTVQQLLAAVPGERFGAYLESEQKTGERHIANTGSIHWLAGFAPMGFNDIRALIPGVSSPGELDADRIDELGKGMAAILNLYAELGFESFNMALYGAPPGNRAYVLNLRMVCRSNLQSSPYRSDVTYFERLHWQAMVDTWPEELAARARPRFST